MKIDSAAIKQLAKLLEDTGLNEIEVAEGESKIRVVKSAGMSGGAYTVPATAAMAMDPAAPGKANTNPPQVNHEEHPGAVTSPMVGTCYLQPEPTAPAFVKKGDTIKAGDTLCIIEAMKVMNPIKAEKGGVVQHIAIKDAQPVEFGDVLFVIE